MSLYNNWFCVEILEQILTLLICTHHREAIDEVSEWVVLMAGQELMKSSLV
jgi:energy-coupling factor transporter ATP-binding protein EcfA2